MQTYINRYIEKIVGQYMDIFPAVAILGPRQCGKSTLAKYIGSQIEDFIYLDLENPGDLNKLNDPNLFFQNNKNSVICIDEIQLKPDLFGVLRSIIDDDRRNGRFLMLGSASRDLIQQSSQTLAGRIGYIDLSPFNILELEGQNNFSLNKHWVVGGFPDSVLQSKEESSKIWRNNFIKTYIERDLPQLGYNISSITARRFLTMCAHNQGQILNSSKLGESLGVTYHTIQNYIHFMQQTFLLRILEPYEINTKKRLVKSPKVYIRDTGLLHSLLEIADFNSLIGHPVFGSSWEGYVIENIVSVLQGWQIFFYRTSSGTEIDLILQKEGRRLAVECKASSAPKPGKGFYMALNDLNINEAWIIGMVDEVYSISRNINVCNLMGFLKHFDLK